VGVFIYYTANRQISDRRSRIKVISRKRRALNKSISLNANLQDATKGVMTMFKNMKIRNKLLISYSTVFVLSMTIGFIAIYSAIKKNIEANIQSELENTTSSILNLVETSVSVSIKNYLRGIAEENLNIVNNLYVQSLNGKISPEAAQKQAISILLSQRIGESGYIYCLDSAGTVVVHPKQALVDVNVSEFAFVRKQTDQKKGYLEYEWKNPGEKIMRPKVLYMDYFKPWDWIISVTAYRSEFRKLVNVDNFRKSVLDLRFGKTGYSFIVDTKGNIIIHPKLHNVNIFASKDFPNQFLREMIRRKTGEWTYYWKNPGEKNKRLKLAIFNYLPDYDWIVASSSYYNEFYKPLYHIRFLFLCLYLITLAMFFPLSYKLSDSITKPLLKLKENFENASRGDFSQRVTSKSNDEVGLLHMYFNRFMERLEEYDYRLKQEIQNRIVIEDTLRESEERYRSIMESAADPIVVYDMNGKVLYFNPAFEKIFGFPLHDCIGKKMDYFVPPENWPETRKMITTVKGGGQITATETKRYTQNGDIRTVSISGAAYRDRNQQATGSVIILRDITEQKRLMNSFLELGDKVRQEIGQDLHDDLCPHLIGTAGLARVLSDTVEQYDAKMKNMAEIIVSYIEEAIEKSRNLARGLCPVHLVSHGLTTALNEIVERCHLTTDIHCRFDGDETLTLHDHLISTHIYYIASEAVNNAIKYSEAKNLTISLSHHEGFLHLTVSDDGKGLPDNIAHQGLGLQIMQYRAYHIGANFDIQTEPGKGTSIHVSIKYLKEDAMTQKKVSKTDTD